MSQNFTAGAKPRRGTKAEYGAFEHTDGMGAGVLGDILRSGVSLIDGTVDVME